MKFAAFVKDCSKSCIGAIAICAALVPQTAISQSTGLAAGVAAVVNDEPITTFDVRQRTRFILITSDVKEPTPEVIVQASQQALNSLINERLQIQEARRFKVQMSDAEVDRILTNQARQNGATLEAFFRDLQQAGISIQSYRDKTRAEVLWQRIVSGRFSSKVKVSRQQVNDALRRILASADKQQYQVSEIFVEVNDASEADQALAGAKTLVNQIRNGSNFAAVARQWSYSPSAAAGGDLGWVVSGELRPEVAKIIDTIGAGQISDPIQVQGGYMIVGVRAKRDGKPPIATYGLKEISKTVPANSAQSVWDRAASSLNSAKAGLRGGCEGVARLATRNGLEVADLGSVVETDLSTEYQARLTDVKIGGTTEVFRTATGVHSMVICSRQVNGDDIPTREQIEDSMMDQEMGTIARGYLRDIRRDAAIVNY